jgi:hypothetical protein
MDRGRPGRNLWFTSSGANQIGRITTAGVVTGFTTLGIVLPPSVLCSFPRGIVAGPDGNLWFADSCGAIGRITTTVTIGRCDSGVPNVLLPGGGTISDRILACAASVGNHGAFVRCVSRVTNDLKAEGIITGAQKGAIQSCAGNK